MLGIIILLVFLLTGYSCSKEDQAKTERAKVLIQKIESFPYSEEIKTNPEKLYELLDELMKIGEPAIPAIKEAIEKTKNEELKGIFNQVLSELIIEFLPSGYTGQLIRTLQDKKKHPDERAKATYYLGQIGGPGAYEALAATLSDEDETIRNLAVVGLGCLGDKRATQPLLDLLSRESSSDIKRSIITALGGVKNKEAELAVIALLSDPLVQGKAIIALGEWKSEGAVPSLIKIAKEDGHINRYSAIKSLGKVGGDQAVTALIELLQDESLSTIIDAAEALATIGDQRAVEPLIAAIRRTDDSVTLKYLKESYKKLTGQEYQE